MLENLQKEEIVPERNHVCCGRCAKEASSRLSQLRSILLDNPGEYLHYDNIFIEFSNPIVAYDDCDKKRYFFTAKGELFNSKNDSLKAKVLFSNLLDNPILFEKSSQKRSMILRNPYRDDSPKWTEEIERNYGTKNLFLVSLADDNISENKDFGLVFSMYSSILDVLKEREKREKIVSLKRKILGLIRTSTAEEIEDKTGVDFLQGIIEEGIYSSHFFEKLKFYYNNR
ncbi:MAG: hypothetical protein ACOZAR_01450 [Patescibacteria group bacterium]